jgi:hypothetical protein
LEKPCWRFSSWHHDIMTSWHRTSQSRSQAGGGHPLWHRGGLLTGIQGWLDVWASCGMGTLGNIGNTYTVFGKRVMAARGRRTCTTSVIDSDSIPIWKYHGKNM